MGGTPLRAITTQRGFTRRWVVIVLRRSMECDGAGVILGLHTLVFLSVCLSALHSSGVTSRRRPTEHYRTISTETYRRVSETHRWCRGTIPSVHQNGSPDLICSRPLAAKMFTTQPSGRIQRLTATKYIYRRHYSSIPIGSVGEPL